MQTNEATNNETTSYRDALARNIHKPGAVVRVLNSYRGSGRFAPDGSEGIYLVKRAMRDKEGRDTADHYLVRLPWDRSIEHLSEETRIAYVRDSSWDLICHASRLEVVL